MTLHFPRQASILTKFLQWTRAQVAGIHINRLEIPPNFKNVEYPERNKLRLYEKVPRLPPNVKPPILRKRLTLIRGPELVHNKLIHKQFGIMALNGGLLRYGHFEVIRNVINRKMDPRCMFAIWRVDPPWKAITKKSPGKRMGGGKGSIHHYATPVKAGRIIFEIGGHTEFSAVRPLLEEIKGKLPLQSAVISQEILERELKFKEELAKRNQNPFSFEYVAKNRMLGVHKYLRKCDYVWFGKYM